MKARPIPNGAIRIDLEDGEDWRLLSRLLMDAQDPEYDLAADVSGKCSDEEVVEDWGEFVVPDLRDEFDASMGRVVKQIEEGYSTFQGEAGHLIVSREVCGDWYGVLNRARLALEARHHFPPVTATPKMTPEMRAARLRDRLYCALQGLLLDHCIG